MSRANTWQNPDGLQVGFGTHSKDDRVPRVFAGPGQIKTLSFEISGADLELTTITSASFPPQAAKLKRGSIILDAKLVTTTAWPADGGSVTVGTYKDTSDAGTVTVDVAAGIMSAVATTSFDTLIEAYTPVGTLVDGTVVCGATSDSDVYIGAFATVAQTTGGRSILTLTYVEPVFNVSSFITTSTTSDNVGPAF